MSEPETSIVATGLGKRYGSHTAIRDLTFSVRKGEIVGFLGPNGAGKSTTLRIITGILDASRGQLTVCGLPVPYHAAEIRRRIGYMPENNPLPEDMRVIEYLRLRARLKGIPARQRKARVEHAMEVCELHHKARRRIIGTLSKGFRQRVGIADAILAAPDITILDEPTIGLDPHQVLSIRQLLDNLRGQTTVIFSSHILSEVEISCDRVLILNQGYLVAQGTPAELRREFLPGTRFQAEVAARSGTLEAALQPLAGDWGIAIDPRANGEFAAVLLSCPAPDADGEALLARLNSLPGLRVRAFRALEPGLEEIFLTATRRSWQVPREEIETLTPSPLPPP